MRFVFLILILIGNFSAKAQEVFIKSATFTPFFKDKNESDQVIGPLLVDKFPVTNKEFLTFVKIKPQWRKSQIKKIFADSNYLEHWTSDLSFAKGFDSYPVTNVSWFVAQKFCKNQNKRLLTTAEWEYVSDSQDPNNLNLILDW